jgi:hypothetical protein
MFIEGAASFNVVHSPGQNPVPLDVHRSSCVLWANVSSSQSGCSLSVPKAPNKSRALKEHTNEIVHTTQATSGVWF